MENSHIYVPILDASNLLGFMIKAESGFKAKEAELQRVSAAITEFVRVLSEEWGIEIFYLGSDEITEKRVERYLFNAPGFMEFMVDDPVTIVGHFISGEGADLFVEAMRRTIRRFAQPSPDLDMFIASISSYASSDETLTA